MVRAGSLKVSRYPVDTVAGSELQGDADAPEPGMVKGPYVAETYSVARDGDYLVVELPTGVRSQLVSPEGT